MSTQKFKIGDRVKWRDYEGRARSGVIVETPQGGAIVQGVSFYVKEAQELQPGRWHESHLSLDVPEPKKYATDLETQLGIEIINLNHRLNEEISKNLLFIEHLNDVQTECVRRGDLLNAAPKPTIDAITHLSNRLTEEIGGRARERIARESAEADTKRMAEGNKWLIDALSAEARAKEAAQRELAKANDSLHFQRMELRKAMEDRSVEWLANEAAKKELADLRKDLADLSNRLTEEIGGRARERIAKEAALAAESLALDSLRQIAETLGEESILRERIPALAERRIKELEASYKQLNHASELLICETESFSKERRLREAVQGDNRRLIDSKIMLLQEVAVERVAKEAALAAESLALDSLHEIAATLGDKSNLTPHGLREKVPALAAWKMKMLEAAQRELADVRKDLADIRIISKRLAL